jgi:hypothetical protein
VLKGTKQGGDVTMFDICHLSHYHISLFLFGLRGLNATCLHGDERYIIGLSILCDGGYGKQHGFLFSSMALAWRICGSVLLRELRFLSYRATALY